MIDHMGIHVTDLDASVAFFTQALAPLGYTLVVRFDGVAGFGVDGKPDFWLHVGTPNDKVHVAFRAKGRAEVRAFHAAALTAGATDNGPPGPREHHHPDYYGAFARDLDGHNIEACCHIAYLD